ncbi:hypothetical protein RUM43_011385 [Polyplax serrata]|uniref:Uncharacterized protein n=1 Tax=Polyplax serrata TaxID=468196 RepID=A0AAN8S3M9_POLSC
MYKTVRHGENSLQYKILAQQEDGGIPNVKHRRSTRGKTAGIITIVLLLVCGVIATAVLVPLILTNDFITLTGTFQKFLSLKNSIRQGRVQEVGRIKKVAQLLTPWSWWQSQRFYTCDSYM